MASIKQEITRYNRELKPMLDIYEQHAYRQGYYQVFSDFIDFCINEYSIGIDTYKLPHYIQQPENEPHDFVKMLDVVIRESRLRCNLWQGDAQKDRKDIFNIPVDELGKEVREVVRHIGGSESISGWYDPFGSFFESVASNFGKSASGQFFTPVPLCNMIAQINITPPEQATKVEKILEPACGSGRMVLAANAINPMNYHVSNDLDQLCAKMTAVNYCLNGVVGEITCNNGLWNTEDNYRFGYQCVPLAATQLGEEKLFKMWSFMTKAIRNQFVLIPITFEQASFKLTRETIGLISIEQDRRDEVNSKGLEGLLFEVEKINTNKPKESKKPKPVERTEKPKPITTTLELF